MFGAFIRVSIGVLATAFFAAILAFIIPNFIGAGLIPADSQVSSWAGVVKENALLVGIFAGALQLGARALVESQVS